MASKPTHKHEKEAHSADNLSWWVPVMSGREKDLLGEVIDANFPNDGAYTTRFEDEIRAICETDHAVAVTSGTMALAAALMACGVGAGDEVIVPDITFIATANAVSLCGAVPVLVDVRLADFTLDPAAVARAITPRTKALIPVHVSGRAAQMDALMSLAAEHGLVIIEDAAEGLGSRWGGRPLGSIGAAGCFSFSPAKTITTGQGGMVTTNDADLAERLRMLKDQGRPVRGTGGADVHLSLGYNFKFTNLQAAMGLAQLESLAERLAHQRAVYEWYAAHLPQDERLWLGPFDLPGGETPQWVDLWVEGRDALYDFLIERRIQPRKFWFPLHTQTPYRGADADFPAATAVGQHALWLPSALTMTEADVVRVCGVIQEWLHA
ncbi:MAG: DegT/DnrJ/EryC1/StrS family aminotransferase [Anaerolineales bacterium]